MSRKQKPELNKPEEQPVVKPVPARSTIPVELSPTEVQVLIQVLKDIKIDITTPPIVLASLQGFLNKLQVALKSVAGSK